MLSTIFRDNLPKGLSFPLGLETLAKGIPNLAGFNTALMLIWQSTWASQLHDPEVGEDGRLTVLVFRATPPRMRINALKVRDTPEDCASVIIEYPMSSTLRRRVLDAFVDHGGPLVSSHIAASNAPHSFGVGYRVDTGRLEIFVQTKRRPTLIFDHLIFPAFVQSREYIEAEEALGKT